jgi:formylglycine-generating enzyme required for sulfatase activity
MNDHLHWDLATLSDSEVRRADQACDGFEAAWKSGPRPRIENYLATVRAESERAALLHELLLLEVDFRRLANENPTPEEYVARFPTLDFAWIRDALAAPDRSSATSPGPERPGEAEIPGQLGKYQLLERVGQGSCGTVWRARDTQLDRVVALKVPHPGLLTLSRNRERFEREARAAARLSHPNVVTLFGVDQAGDTSFLVMEYVEGIDLARVVKESGPLPIRQACHSIRQAALGLQHAHESGLVHRDIKPANLVLTAEGVVKVLDLGLVRLLRLADEAQVASLTSLGSMMGTADYIAPEQARDARSADARADIYSLGCSLYFLLTGWVPFPGGTEMAKIIRHETEEAEPVEQLRPEVPPELAAVVRRSMARRPEERYQTAAAVADALTAVLPGDSEPEPNLPAGSAGRARRPRRMPWLAGLLLTGLAALGLFLLLRPGGRFDRSEPPNPPAPAPAPPAAAELAITNSLGMALVRIRGGEFWMGTANGEKVWLGPQEKPCHQVSITRPFYLGACEVTQREYQAVLGSNPSHFTEDRGGGPNHPVDMISYFDAVDFCARLSALPAERQARRTYRLPTEAEWEYACRAGTTTAYHFGCDATQLGDYAWHAGSSGGRTHPVRTLRPNAWGLYDMYGNVWEWCADIYDANYYSRSPTLDPFSIRGSDERVLRGGGWAETFGDGRWCRSAARGYRSPNTRLNHHGLRVACEVPAG